MEAVAPGARVVIRDAEWLVRRIDTTSTGGYSIHAMGLSELVKDRDAIFLTELERHITVLDPAEAKLVPNTSPQFCHALLYIESLLRQIPPTDPPSEEKIYLGHKAAMDLVGYQLDPARFRWHAARATPDSEPFSTMHPLSLPGSSGAHHRPGRTRHHLRCSLYQV